MQGQRDIVDIHAKVGLWDVTENIAELPRLQAATILVLEHPLPVLQSQFDQIPR